MKMKVLIRAASVEAALRGQVEVSLAQIGAAGVGEYVGVVDIPDGMAIPEMELRYRPCAYDGKASAYLHAQRVEMADGGHAFPVGEEVVLPLRQMSEREWETAGKSA